jgi:ubiquinone/menaquinone biosynthesis C-methylase UbiE
MRITTIPQSIKEALGMALGMVPTPLCDVTLGPLVANAVIAASSVHLFDALESGERTSAEVAAHCGTDRVATERLMRALYVSNYLKWNNGLYCLTRRARRWLLNSSKDSLHFAILHRSIDFRFFDFESYVRRGEARDFHQELNSEEWTGYHRGQAVQAKLLADELIRKVRLSPSATKMLDLGGGHGVYSLAFCNAYPGLRSRILDLATPLDQRPLTQSADKNYASVSFEAADVRTATLGTDSVDVVLIANLIHHFDESTNRGLLQRVTRALVSGGVVIVLDLMRAASVKQAEQFDALMDVYFGAASGSQLWTVDQVREWQASNGLIPQPPLSMSLLPACKVLVARKL